MERVNKCHRFRREGSLILGEGPDALYGLIIITPGRSLPFKIALICSLDFLLLRRPNDTSDVLPPLKPSSSTGLSSCSRRWGPEWDKLYGEEMEGTLHSDREGAIDTIGPVGSSSSPPSPFPYCATV